MGSIMQGLMTQILLHNATVVYPHKLRKIGETFKILGKIKFLNQDGSQEMLIES